jgi:putative transposase
MKEVAVDKNFNRLIVTSIGNIYGEKMGEKVKNYTETLNKKNKQRNKIYAYERKLRDETKKSEEKIKRDQAKADRIRKHNLGKKKYNQNKFAMRADIESYLNQSINDFLRKEKPDRVILEDLTFQTKDKNKYPPQTNRQLKTWMKGLLQERFEYKLVIEGIGEAAINPAYTSQTCNRCKHLGVRRGSRFYCQNPFCKHYWIPEGVDADLNAALNILDRYYDSEISLYTPYRRVKEILLLRMQDSTGNSLQFEDTESSAGASQTREMIIVGDKSEVS